jgi:hypothetical protein
MDKFLLNTYPILCSFFNMSSIDGSLSKRMVINVLYPENSDTHAVSFFLVDIEYLMPSLSTPASFPPSISIGRDKTFEGAAEFSSCWSKIRI